MPNCLVVVVANLTYYEEVMVPSYVDRRYWKRVVPSPWHQRGDMSMYHPSKCLLIKPIVHIPPKMILQVRGEEVR